LENFSIIHVSRCGGQVIICVCLVNTEKELIDN